MQPGRAHGLFPENEAHLVNLPGVWFPGQPEAADTAGTVWQSTKGIVSGILRTMAAGHDMHLVWYYFHLLSLGQTFSKLPNP
jgi:hypothetical protein